MGERRTFHTHQMLELNTDQRYCQIYSDNSLMGSNNLGHGNEDVNLLLRDSGNSLSTGPHINVPSSLNEPYILPSSSRNVSLPWNSMTANYLPSPDNGALLVDNYAGNAHVMENTWEPFRTENVQQGSVSYLYFNGSRSSDTSFPYVSQSFGSLDETGVNVPKHSTLTQPEHRESRTSQTPGGSLRSVTNRLSSINTPLRPAYLQYPKDFLSSNLAAQSFQPASNPWMAQHANVISAGGYPCWSYTNPIRRSHVAPDMACTAQAYKHVRPTLCPTSLNFSYEDLHLAQSMQANSCIGHPQIAIPAAFYQHPLNNLQPNNLNPSPGFQSSPGLLSFMSTGEQIYRPPVQLVHAYQEMGNGSGRTLSFENAASSELSTIYEVANVIDEHSDMRLDIDGMSYEELLALEEKIGDVKTGLTEECISKNLKENIHVRKFPNSLPENETCVICQAEYGDGERLGTLNCGHKYHSPCIRQWLQIKNLCPICKITALANS